MKMLLKCKIREEYYPQSVALPALELQTMWSISYGENNQGMIIGRPSFLLTFMVYFDEQYDGVTHEYIYRDYDKMIQGVAAFLISWKIPVSLAHDLKHYVFEQIIVNDETNTIQLTDYEAPF